MLYIAGLKQMCCFNPAMPENKSLQIYFLASNRRHLFILHINSYFKFIYKDLSSNFFNKGERCPGKCATPSTKMAYCP